MTRRTLRLTLVAAVALTLVAGLWARRELRSRGLSVGDIANQLRRGAEPRFTWQSVDDKHWQIVAAVPGESASVTDAREGTSAGCPAGMVHVRGAFRSEGQGTVTGEIERVQDAACTDWISRDFPARCRVFDSAKIARDIERFPTVSMDYCIDRFEYPNVFGEYPMIVATYREASAMCKKASKRLCTENEWTFACEGEEARPYPYGETRDGEACVVDRPWRLFTEGALQPRNGNGARQELDQLWQGEASGARPGCRSPFGVYDMTGNVDEWTSSVNATGFRSVLKGGYWGPVRARCRPSTRAHNEDFIAYQQSFRCCAEAGDEEDEPIEDAGVPDASTHAADASSPPLPVLDAVWRQSDAVRREAGDELEAIARARASCSASVQDTSASPWIAFAMVSLAVMRRRAQRASTCPPSSSTSSVPS